MGGLIYVLCKYTGDPEKALRFAVAVAEVEQLRAGSGSGQVSR